MESRRRNASVVNRPYLLIYSIYCTSMLSACSTVGITSIDQGRTPYNEVIQDTSKQQALLNIVRVKHSDSPLFMDVTEVDQATTVVGSITGGASSIGARPNPNTAAGTYSGILGALTGTTSYQEAPTVRYIPLSGQALIAQVSTPITAESLANFKNSDWSLAAILTLGVDRLTPNYLDYDTAVDAIVDLDNYGAIIIAATQSSEAEKKAKINGLVFSTSAPAAKDTLTIYLKNALLRADWASCDGKHRTQEDASHAVNALWHRLQRIFSVNKNVISITSKASPALSSTRTMAPLLSTRSALGVLKGASEQETSPSIAFLPEATVRRLVEEKLSRSQECADPFYTLDPIEFHPNVFQQPTNRTNEDNQRNQLISQRSRDPTRTSITIGPDIDFSDQYNIRDEEVLSDMRRFMLIAESSSPPNDAFTSVSYDGKWYSILREDNISKRTLALINQFNTVQAIPSQNAALTPTISVGGGR